MELKRTGNILKVVFIPSTTWNWDNVELYGFMNNINHLIYEYDRWLYR